MVQLAATDETLAALSASACGGAAVEFPLGESDAIFGRLD
jgi:hypothetical protein